MRTARSLLVRLTSPVIDLGRFSPEKWILTTYADDSLVVARDNFGGLLILEREDLSEAGENEASGDSPAVPKTAVAADGSNV